MKLLSALTLTTALIISPVSLSQELTEDSSVCETVHVIAKSVMTARQNGMSIVDVVKLSEEKMAGTDSAQYIPIVEQMAHIAYGQRKYSSESYQQEAITEFGNTMYIACKQARGGQ